jgi:hypothetical protein
MISSKERLDSFRAKMDTGTGGFGFKENSSSNTELRIGETELADPVELPDTDRLEGGLSGGGVAI